MRNLSSKLVHLVFYLIVCVLVISSCTAKRKASSTKISTVDTSDVIQTALSDKNWEAKLVKYFKNQPLTLIENSLVKDYDQYNFASKPVKIVRVVGNLDEIHEKYAGKFFISVRSVKFISEDSATVFSILHAGNTTYFLGLRKQENNWLIRSREYGKF